jgi:hypothetical protein
MEKGQAAISSHVQCFKFKMPLPSISSWMMGWRKDLNANHGCPVPSVSTAHSISDSPEGSFCFGKGACAREKAVQIARETHLNLAEAFEFDFVRQIAKARMVAHFNPVMRAR